MFNDIVIVRGGGDVSTGVVHRLYKSGFRKILILEIDNPLVVRRKISFAQAIFDGEVIVEGIKAKKVNNLDEIYNTWNHSNIPIIVDKDAVILKKLKPNILVDAIMAKKNLGTNKNMAPITIAVGPGFCAGKDVDVVVESNRGHFLGRTIFDGYAQENTGKPGEIMGYSSERVLRAPCDGKIKNMFKIGDKVKKGEIVAKIDNKPVEAKISGVLRGIIMDGTKVKKGLKIGDIDPRGIKEYCFTISDKARSIGGGVLEAIFSMKIRKGDLNGK
ncbi:selenium-dependent molybdenum cofactor biosynthesis protein YqeB [Thermohalobacter berrensis]|uniref:Molybdenum hydroxylase n=1 Tax=Thermohalobacter berrensis TaxID=99594 RepID=A0A419T6B0_9FIRM|nr:selenium-dependent molybdenum cofactor biosynthesis protein YqeB [Thermohalobacter berrensis]RKD32943.1 molybdenum hydroxylase [Thermohalobacter berrensis]